eukprot:186747_1
MSNFLCNIKSLQISDKNNKCNSNDDKATLFEAKLSKNFNFIQEFDTLNNLLNIGVDDLLNEIQPQIYCLCGSGQQSSLKMLRYGITISLIGKQNLSQFKISRIWTVPTSFNNNKPKQTSLIICSTPNPTLTIIFKVNSLNEEINDIPPNQSPFDGNSETLHFGYMYINCSDQNINSNNNNNNNNKNILELDNDTALIQITCGSVNFITNKNLQLPYSWRAGGGQTVTGGCNTSRLICVALNDQFILLLKPTKDGKLQCLGKRIEMQSQIIDMSLMATSNSISNMKNSLNATLAIGTINQQITIYSITEQKGDELLNRFTIQEKQDSDKICCVLFEKFKKNSYGYLFIGTTNGYLFRFSLAAIYRVLKPFNPNFVSTLNCEFMKNLGSSSVRLKKCNL